MSNFNTIVLRDVLPRTSNTYIDIIERVTRVLLPTVGYPPYITGTNMFMCHLFCSDTLPKK